MPAIADLPGAAVIVAEGADFAHVDEARGDAGGAQQVDDAVGDPALGDAVERQGHAGAGEGDAVAAGADGVEADAGAGLGEGGGGRAGGVAAGGEVGGVEAPERLDGRVEGAAGRGVEAAAVVEDGDELGRRRGEGAGAVQLAEGGVGAVEAEDRLEAGDLERRSAASRRSAAARSGWCRMRVAGAPRARPCQVTTSAVALRGADDEGQAGGGGEQADGAAAGEAFSGHGRVASSAGGSVAVWPPRT